MLNCSTKTSSPSSTKPYSTTQYLLPLNQTLKFDHTITYPYSDYRGRIELLYNQTLMNSTLAQDGLYLLFSQVLIGDSEF